MFLMACCDRRRLAHVHIDVFVISGNLSYETKSTSHDISYHKLPRLPRLKSSANASHLSQKCGDILRFEGPYHLEEEVNGCDSAVFRSSYLSPCEEPAKFVSDCKILPNVTLSSRIGEWDEKTRRYCNTRSVGIENKRTAKANISDLSGAEAAM